MQVTICDICGKSLNGDNRNFLPEVIGDVWGGVRGGQRIFSLKEADICQNCQEQIFDFVEHLRKNSKNLK